MMGKMGMVVGIDSNSPYPYVGNGCKIGLCGWLASTLEEVQVETRWSGGIITKGRIIVLR
jgi:hypothetical protein